MPYENPNRQVYQFDFDWGGAANETFSIQGPKGAAGILWDYGVQGVTEVFNGGTVTPKIAVGSTTDADAFAEEMDLQGLADNSGQTARSLYGDDVAVLYSSTAIVDKQIPADTEVVVTCTAATGSPTGIGTAYVVIDWQW